jgi:NAD(P)-dependent dehydrogenase (short-subunit alcohol dehydrogenase family)
MKMEVWNDVFDVNLKGTFLTCRSFLDQERMGRWMLAANVDQETTGISSAHSSMSIVNLGSIISEYGNLGQANYATRKGGVLGLTRALAKESARRNVRGNSVLPGFIDTPMAQAIPDHVKTDVILPNIPMGRFGQPEEVADTVAFLLSPRSSYITGEAVRVSGMITLWQDDSRSVAFLLSRWNILCRQCLREDTTPSRDITNYADSTFEST